MSLEGLHNVTTVGAQLTIINNTLLADLVGLRGLTGPLVRPVEIRNNPALTTLNGLQGVTAMAGLNISNNDALTTLEGLNGLVSVSPTVTGMVVRDNLVLADISALASLQLVDDTLSFNFNAALPQCQVDALALRLAMPCTGCINNSSGGPCP